MSKPADTLKETLNAYVAYGSDAQPFSGFGTSDFTRYALNSAIAITGLVGNVADSKAFEAVTSSQLVGLLNGVGQLLELAELSIRAEAGEI